MGKQSGMTANPSKPVAFNAMYGWVHGEKQGMVDMAKQSYMQQNPAQTKIQKQPMSFGGLKNPFYGG